MACGVFGSTFWALGCPKGAAGELRHLQDGGTRSLGGGRGRINPPPRGYGMSNLGYGIWDIGICGI